MNILCKFRCSSHCLKIEKSRYLDIERCRRICDLCNLYTLEDEYHFYWHVLVFVILGKNVSKDTIIHDLLYINLLYS